MTNVEQVLALLPELSTAERQRVLEVLAADPELRTDRAANQAALAHLDSRLAADDDTDDSWWASFREAIDQDRLASRQLFPDDLPDAA